MPDKKKDKKSKSKKTTGQKQKQTQKQSVVVNINTEKKPRKRSSKKSQNKTKQSQGNNINISPVISFPSQEQMYRQVHTDIQNQPPPVLGNSNDINASITGILNSIRQQNTPNKQEALSSVIPKMEVLKEQATQSIKAENQFNKDIEHIKAERTRHREDDNHSLLGDDTIYRNNAADSIQGVFKGHLARNKARTRAAEVNAENIQHNTPYHNAATKIQSVLRGHRGRDKVKEERFDLFANTDMYEAIERATQNGSGNVVFDFTPKKPVVLSTPPPARTISQNVNNLSAQLVFDDVSNSPAPAKRGRGRPVGSTNRSKELKELEKNAKRLAKSVLTRKDKLKN